MSTITADKDQYKSNLSEIHTEQFLRTIWPSKLLTTETLELRVKIDGEVRNKGFARSVEEFIKLANKYKDHDVYFGVATRNGKERGTKERCYHVNALWCDLDNKKIEECKFPLPPTLVVNSGKGVHAYWVLKESVLVVREDSWATIEDRVRWLVQQCGGDKNTCDVSRVLRVPGKGFFNQKYDPPRQVKVESYSGIQYDLDDFGELPKATQDVEPCTLAGGTKSFHSLTASQRDRLAKAGGGRFNDPSREDSSLITAMLRKLSPADVYATFDASERGEDARERKKGHYEDYMQRTIEKAVAFLKASKGEAGVKVKTTTDDGEIEYGTDVIYGRDSESDAENDQWRIYSGADAVRGADEAPQWVIESLIAEESGLLCSGLAHSTKSLIWLCAALQASMGVPVWGKFAVSQKVKNVVFIETEDPRRKVMMRLRHFCKGLGIDHPPQSFHLIRPGPFDLVEQGEQKLLEIIEKTKADLLVLSTLQGLLGGRNWKEQAEMGPVNEIAVKLQGKCALVVITHSPHNEKRAAGTVTQAANYSSLLHVVKHKDEDTGNTVSTIEFDSKEGGEDKFKLDLDIREHEYSDRKTTQVWNVVFQGAQKRGRPSKAQNKKEQAEELKEEGKSVREIGKELGVSKSAVQRLFN